MAKKKTVSDNWDKSGSRLWLVYEFWRPADFARNHDISERSVRHYLQMGMPSHGVAHKGSGGIRLAKSAVEWLRGYRYSTGNGSVRFGELSADFLEYLASLVSDESMAYSKLYRTAWPEEDDRELDVYLSPREAARERKSWKSGFKEIKRKAD